MRWKLFLRCYQWSSPFRASPFYNIAWTLKMVSNICTCSGQYLGIYKCRDLKMKPQYHTFRQSESSCLTWVQDSHKSRQVRVFLKHLSLTAELKKIGKFTLHRIPKIKWTENIEKCQVFLIFAFLSINFVYFYKLSHIPFDSLLKWPNYIILAFLGVCLA